MFDLRLDKTILLVVSLFDVNAVDLDALLVIGLFEMVIELLHNYCCLYFNGGTIGGLLHFFSDIFLFIIGDFLSEFNLFILS